MNSLILIIVAIASFLVGMVIALCIIGITDVVSCNREFAKNLRKYKESELSQQTTLIKIALLEGIETIEFGVIDKPSHISLIKDPYKNNEICLRVFVQKEGAAFYYSLNSYGVLWKLKDDKWKEGEDA